MTARAEGIYLVFDETFPAEARDRLHERRHAKVIFRAGGMPLDAVVPAGAFTDASLIQLCLDYLGERGVQSCDLNRPTAENAPPPHAVREVAPAPRPVASPEERIKSCRAHEGDKDIPAELRRRGLAPGWNRETMGADLAEEAIAATGLKLDEPAIAFAEIGKDPNHIAGVADLLKQFSGQRKLGEPLIDRNEAQLVVALRELRKTRPAVANFSQTIGSSDIVYEEFKKLAEHTLPVISLGNSYPFEPGKNELRVPAITVASANPHGMLSHFVQEGNRANGLPNIDILVPSDQWLVAHDKDGGWQNFGWNSGAAPQVAGMLARATAILPGLDVEEARYLLKKTSIPTHAGVGIFNAYKFIRLCLRLRERGGKDWKKTFREDRTILDFNEEGTRLAAEATKEWAAMKADLTAGRAVSCEREAALRRLARRAFLIVQNTRNVSSRDGKMGDGVKAAARIADSVIPILADLYRREGLEHQARFFDNQSIDRLKADLPKLIKGDDDFDARAAVRQAGRLRPPSDDLIRFALKEGNPRAREWAVYAGVESAHDAGKFLKEALTYAKATDDPVVDAVALASLGLDGGGTRFFRDRYDEATTDDARKLALTGAYVRVNLKKARKMDGAPELAWLRDVAAKGDGYADELAKDLSK